MFSNLDPEIASKIKGLKMQFTEEPQPNLLIVVPNPSENKYMIDLTYPEFTSLCPFATTQPDFATVNIRYIPQQCVVELKSLKFYLTSYRNVAIFHEAVANTIMDDLVKVLSPYSLKVIVKFTTRGGIDTNVESEHRI